VRRGVQAGAVTIGRGRVALVGNEDAGQMDGQAILPGALHGERPRNPATMRYQLTEVCVDLGNRLFHDLPTDYLASLLQKVVETESPIHVDEAARRLANSCGLERVGARIRAAVFEACRTLEQEGLVRRRGDFLWDPAGELRVRDRSDAPVWLRNIALIAPDEIVLAAQSFGGSESEVEDVLVFATSRLLGFRRTGKDVYSVIRSVLVSELRPHHV